MSATVPSLKLPGGVRQNIVHLKVSQLHGHSKSTTLKICNKNGAETIKKIKKWHAYTFSPAGVLKY